MDYLYHGSSTPGIIALEARSLLHGTDKMVVYLTDCVPYALFYVWDSQHTGSARKHVTGACRNGQAIYEEQFPGQLRTFYQGVSGYLYRIQRTEQAQPMPNRDGLYWQTDAAAVADVLYIPDVYAELLKYEAAGLLKVLRFNDQPDARKAELTGMIAAYIRQRNFFPDDPEQQRFMKRHFTAAWRLANEQTD